MVPTFQILTNKWTMTQTATAPSHLVAANEVKSVSMTNRVIPREQVATCANYRQNAREEEKPAW